ncbi:MAG: hypothetical protein M0007_14185 [Actinomycetota bacterium]|nr:hypothetical protein [Actinomycetota bacterium]
MGRLVAMLRAPGGGRWASSGAVAVAADAPPTSAAARASSEPGQSRTGWVISATMSPLAALTPVSQQAGSPSGRSWRITRTLPLSAARTLRRSDPSSTRTSSMSAAAAASPASETRAVSALPPRSGNTTESDPWPVATGGPTNSRRSFDILATRSCCDIPA